MNMVAEGIIDGKVVCTQKKMPSRRSTKLRLYIDTPKVNLVADGSDFIVVVAEVPMIVEMCAVWQKRYRFHGRR